MLVSNMENLKKYFLSSSDGRDVIQKAFFKVFVKEEYEKVEILELKKIKQYINNFT
jgi:hypothetical protein